MSVFSNQRGIATFSAIMMAVISVMITVGMMMLNNRINQVFSLRSRSGETVILNSFIQTFSETIKFSHSRYMILTSNCSTGPGFFDAFDRGHECAAAGDVPIFNSLDVDGLSLADSSAIQFNNGWIIHRNGPATAPNDKHVATFDLTVLPGMTMSGKVYLQQTVPNQSIAIFEVRVYRGETYDYSREFAIRTSDLQYQVHLRTSDARTVAGSTIPQDPCDNQMGDEYRDPVQGCLTSGSIGGGTGLVRYQGRYFGLHPLGHLVLLGGSNNEVGQIVGDNGRLPSGLQVFPPRSRDNMVNVAEIEVNAEDQGMDEIVLIQGSGIGTELRYYNPVTQENDTVCKIGEMGIASRTVGLSALAGNQSLFSRSPTSLASTANFLLKTHSGTLFLLSVRAQRSPSNYAIPDTASQVYFNPSIGKYYICAAKQIDHGSNDLMKITTGSTRTGFEKGGTYVY